MSGGGTKTTETKQTQTSDPWAPAQPALQQILGGAKAAYESGVGSQVYGGDRTAGLGDTTNAGLASMAANANGTAGATANGANYLQTLLGNGGTTASIQNALSGLLGVQGVDTSGVASAASRMGSPTGAASTVGNAMASGAYNLDGSGYKTLADQLGTGTQTERSLQAVANGDYLGGANPFTEKMISQGAGDAASAVAQRFAASGRYGSGRFSGAIADATDRVGTELRYKDYDAERARQAAAASAIDSAANARTGVQSGLLDSQNNVRTANASQAVTGANLASGADAAALTGQNALAALLGQNNQQALSQFGTALSSAASDRSAAMAGLGQIGTVQAALNQPGQTLAGIGAIQDAARQEELDAARGVFDEQQNAPWKQLGLYTGLASPIAGMGGTTVGNTIQKTPQPSLLQQILGTALAGANVASKFI